MSATPSRSLNLTGATNFRDLGGYRGADGRPVRWRRLFRSDHLAALTPQDEAALGALGLARAFDFRGVAERAATAYRLPGVVQHPLPIEPTVVQNLDTLRAAGRQLTARDAESVMRDTYRAFVRGNSHRFGTLLRHLADDHSPAVFHCTAGKDRTGFAAALLLLAMGVSREEVEHDFLLTNQHYRRAHASQTDLPQEVLDVLWRVQSGFLAAAFEVVGAEHGGVDRYLETIGIGAGERRRLIDAYLES